MKIKINLFLLIFILMNCFSISFAENCSNDSCIKIKKAVDNKIEGAAGYQSSADVKNSPYFPSFDFYNICPSKTLILLKNFRTYQQTSEYTCGAACALMVFNYLGFENISEDSLAKEADARNLYNPRKDGSIGITTENLKKLFVVRSIKTESSADFEKKNGKVFSNYKDFAKYVKQNLNKKNPIIVENVTYGGHWLIIIGYDDMGTKCFEDDVLIFADPYDVFDHCQDGYLIKNFAAFFDEWFDRLVLPSNQSVQQFVTVFK